MTKELLEDLERNIDLVEPTRKYWFVRTNSGFYYDQFVKGGFIAIGIMKLLFKILQVQKEKRIQALH